MSAAELPAELGAFGVDGVLGAGGSAVVYAARMGTRPVALKVLRPELELAPAEVERMLAEARTMARLQHPGVVLVIDAGVLPDGRPYLVMPRLEGEPLTARLARGRLALAEAAELFAGLAAGVGALHEAGLVHRDLKPDNVFVRDRGGPVLLDLGIARELHGEPGTTTRAGFVRGTPAFMAPERFFGAPATVASDVYELALILYCMLVGRLPWDDGEDPAQRLDPAPPARHGVVLPEAMTELLAGALSTRAERRPPSVRALADAVRAAAAGAASAGPPPRRTADLPAPRPLPAPPMPVPGRPLAAAAVALFALCALLIFSVGSDSGGAPTTCTDRLSQLYCRPDVRALGTDTYIEDCRKYRADMDRSARMSRDLAAALEQQCELLYPSIVEHINRRLGR